MKSENLLEVRDLVVRFGGFVAINHVTFSMKRGEIKTIIGPNGAGKTTFLDALCGKTEPFSGEIQFTGSRINELSEFERTRAGMGRKFQTPSVYEDLTVFENIQISVPAGQKILPSIFDSRDRFREQILELALLTNLSGQLAQRAASLSHGQKQWLEIAMLLVQHPKLLMLDEPVAGMSIKERDQTVDLIKRISASQAIIVIEHDMEFVKKLASNVTVFHQGAVLCEGSVESIQADSRVQEVYLGE